MTALSSSRVALLLGLCLPLLAACSDDDTIADGSSGSGGSGGGEDADVSDPSGVTTIAQAVVLWDSCIGSDDGVQNSLNNAYYERRAAGSPNLISSGLAKNLIGVPATCDDAVAASGVTIEASTEACGQACEGDTVVVCDGTHKYTVDCNRAFGVGCKDGDCDTNPNGEACDNSTFEESCVDGRPLVCTDETVQGLPCADYGLDCAVVDPIGVDFPSAFCVGTGAACEVERASGLEHNYLWNPIDCADATHLRMCVTGQEHTADCAQVAPDFGCHASGGVSFCGKASECNPNDDAFCEGDAVVVCDAGKRTKIDCTKLGFSTCNAAKVLCE